MSPLGSKLDSCEQQEGKGGSVAAADVEGVVCDEELAVGDIKLIGSELRIVGC